MERVRLVARRREGGGGREGREGQQEEGSGDVVGPGAEDVEGEGERKTEDEGRERQKEEENMGDVMEEKEKGTVVQGSSSRHMPGRPKMPSSRYPPPSLATATGTAAIEPIVQRY